MASNDHPLIVKSIAWATEADTQAFAAALAAKLQDKASSDVLIELHGDLGSGKTTFARHLLTAMGVTGRIKSPTYAVVEPYTVDDAPGGPLNIWHFDFYRFNDPDEWEEAGFRDIFASPGLKLVEWPEKAGDHLPPADLDMALELQDDDARAVTLTAHTDAGAALLP
ncbi:MAG: tRNA (adenosine(37)-N6)-threonylcarbamoyltransferase complex ATPase subunit type 1 TsaE [Polaromonas sp.]|uniref:tRNA (adenosine(37)-N6)-threonylcarbamoyltransferase complex ATPase subunit type 1 TsaE n=1 Tax=Polaromonas sp. TaxID=1869339 RepID=UPI002730C674|nr:tRNA (adenosine(37)-N6)-threonylcarbamoyltransferase complex ATPase subunit type 1 TsaE [Polaromonas sp.]MDP1739791.1 tRNA (adenosine(37)-N6)-threonylcarbamoyltransferase complex ATPase subunit type 1 TsaE [Polaromonas sp.]MDP1955781.1 tRNA (adenosine(37)-N6)-threonylcarbamoyltransferase complex ATPase subunit type 1 TsaE [Polaromonas sp.]MDP3355280.1 tRNA (adenosine(37)-N6)-threonylcarbamoyltransferase complex ATPase subunit type 1 TsaE [Polaromonas sp.]MDP3751623.1 tRNA (adenosine(37)-N6)-